MKKAILILVLVICFGHLCFSKIVNSSYRVSLDGGQSVPESGSGSTGQGTLRTDKNTKELYWEITHNVGNPLTGHIHFGKPGENGPPVIEFASPPTSPITGSIKITEEIAEKLRFDETYVNIHTENNPQGEIRGQILIESIEAVAIGEIKLNGEQQVPPVNTTDFKGKGEIRFSNFTDILEYKIVHDVDEPVMAHIHVGEEGTNGPVVLEFESAESPIEGVFEQITPEVEAALLENRLYVNIHTEENPNGEIRGQIIITEFLTDLEKDNDESEEDDGLSGGAIFGIVFSVLLLSAAAIAAAAYFYQKKKRSAQRKQAASGGYVRQNDTALLDDAQVVEVGDFP